MFVCLAVNVELCAVNKDGHGELSDEWALDYDLISLKYFYFLVYKQLDPFLFFFIFYSPQSSWKRLEIGREKKVSKKAEYV